MECSNLRTRDLPHPYDEFRVNTLALPMVGLRARNLDLPTVERLYNSPFYLVERLKTVKEESIKSTSLSIFS